MANCLGGWRSGVAGLLLCFLLGRGSSLTAQTAGTGALIGTITDSTGAVVPNATVTATSVDTGQARTSTTGSDAVTSSICFRREITR
jgi:hypothetical protein